jgi:hypothetical protein
VVTERAHDLADQLRVVASAEGRIQIHEVDPFSTLVDPRSRGFQRLAVDGLRSSLTLDQTDRLTIGHIDGGQEFQQRRALMT